MLRKYWPIFAVVVVCLILPAVTTACPNCKSMIEDKGTGGSGGSMAGGIGGNMAAGYYYSILFMLGILSTLVCALFFVVRREGRRASIDQ